MCCLPLTITLPGRWFTVYCPVVQVRIALPEAYTGYSDCCLDRVSRPAGNDHPDTPVILPPPETARITGAGKSKHVLTTAGIVPASVMTSVVVADRPAEMQSHAPGEEYRGVVVAW